jgi:hypothetical protein
MMTCAALFALAALQDTVPSKDLAARLNVRGALLSSEDFAGPELGAEWKRAHGSWTIVDGALRGKELAEDNHAAVLKHALPAKDVVLQFSFKFDGAKQATCSFDGKGHICRVILTPSGFSLRRDVPKNGAEKPQTLAKAELDLKPGTWHTMLIEIRGKEFLAQVDDRATAVAEHEGIALDKTTFGFPVVGDGFIVDAVRVWEAQPNPAWPAEKAKLDSKP